MEKEQFDKAVEELMTEIEDLQAQLVQEEVVKQITQSKSLNEGYFKDEEL